jgi:hypothetical protein
LWSLRTISQALKWIGVRTELQLAQDQVLRKAAEFQNYRRRTEEEKRLMVDIGKGAVVERLLDVVDDFSRMIDAADAADSNETPDNLASNGCRDDLSQAHRGTAQARRGAHRGGGQTLR